MSFLKRDKPRGRKTSVLVQEQTLEAPQKSHDLNVPHLPLSPTSKMDPGPNDDTVYFDNKYSMPAKNGINSVEITPESRSRNDLEGSLSGARFSPRSSFLNVPIQPAKSPQLKDSYRGFHANKSVTNVPPLDHPIKPRFKKKSSLLGKLIYPNRKDENLNPAQDSSASVSSGSNSGSTSSTLHTPQIQRGKSFSLIQSLQAAQPNASNGSLNSHHHHSLQPSARHASFINPSHLYPRTLSLAVPGSGASSPHKHKFRIPSISLFDHRNDDNPSRVQQQQQKTPLLLRSHLKADISMDLNNEDVILLNSKGSNSSDKSASTMPADSNVSQGRPTFDLDINEMQGIIKLPSSTVNKVSLPEIKRIHKSNLTVLDTWRAPDSWDVNLSAAKKTAQNQQLNDSNSLGCLLECDSDHEDEDESGSEVDDEDLGPKKRHHHHHHHHHHHGTSTIAPILSNLPVLFQYQPQSEKKLTSTSPNIPKSNTAKSAILRVFKDDNTFSTITAPMDVTAAELLLIVQKKFFLELVSNCQISVAIGLSVKVLEPYEKPIRIQMDILELLGYTDKEDITLFGREDLSFICKFILEDILLRQLTHEEELLLLKDYVEVNILGLNLKNIPIIFHQHNYEIEKLDVGNNPLMYIPLDFIQLCNNLTNIVYLRNGCSKFPMNLLAARKLTSLDLEKNFLNELPSRFGHLHNLTTLKLNLNQLQLLPRLFGKLTQLRVLNLSSNFFSTYPPEISELDQLVDLDLSYNDLLAIPELIGKLKQLAKLNLSTNKLETAIPAHFKNLVLLKRLDIRYNKISNIDVLGTLPGLEVAYVSKNNISAFNDRMDNLRLLHFDRNPITNLQFENTLPILTVLDLSRAKVTSVPPEFISRIPNIEKLVLDKNHLVTLPEELGNLPKLTVLSVYGNNLQVLPNSIGKLTLLQYLDVHLNNLQQIPEEIWALKQLSMFNVALNILTSFPKIPVSIQGQQLLIDSLLMLTLADNRLNDEIFELISVLTELKFLNLSYNDITEVPEGATRQMTKLTELYLSGNEIALLPADDLEHLKSLKLLHLNSNKFVTLPAELAKLTSLQVLDVGSNQLKYNILNWPYDWNWHWNKALRYLNFLGNRRFEIKQLHTKNPETGEDFDSLLVLENLKVLGLIDVTLTTTLVPDQNFEMRIRTTASELENIGFGVSDSMGMRECVLTRDIFMQKYRGNEDEVLIITIDGKLGGSARGHRILLAVKLLIVPLFTEELKRVEDEAEKANKAKLKELKEGETLEEVRPNINDALRRTYLALNRDINGVLASLRTTDTTSKTELELSIRDDAAAGCSVTTVYIRKKTIYVANVGDIEALLCHPNGEHTLLTTKHDPTNRLEFERIRATGGYVSGDGLLDGELPISRGVGFFNFLPHTNLGPDLTSIEISALSSGTIIVATKVVWDYILYELAVDIVRQEKDDPMRAAQKLRDYAICYGASDKINVLIITLGSEHSKKVGGVGNRGYMGRNRQSNNQSIGLNGTEELVYSKRRPDRTLTGDQTLMRLDEEIDPPVGELALVFTDIKNLTLLWDAYPVAMRLAIKIHNAIMRRQLRIVGGYEVKTEGDAFMVSFPSPSAALLWTFSVQQQLLTADWPEEILQTEQCCEITDNEKNVIFRGLLVRMGIHWGSPVYEMDVVTRRMDYFGPMVNRSARIQAVADGGQIAISMDFLREMEGLFKSHKLIKSGESTIEDQYQGNAAFGEVIERELSQIDELGFITYELGERKLKGLEVPELITLVYPEKLRIRYDIFLEEADENTTESRLVGALPIESIFGLRLVLLRLENVLAKLTDNQATIQLFQETSLSKILEALMFKDKDLVAMLSHITTRIEHYVAVLELRQMLLIASGDDGRLGVNEPRQTLDLVDELKKILQISTQKST